MNTNPNWKSDGITITDDNIVEIEYESKDD